MDWSSDSLLTIILRELQVFRQKFFYGFDDLIFKMFSPLYISFLLGISSEEEVDSLSAPRTAARSLLLKLQVGLQDIVHT